MRVWCQIFVYPACSSSTLGQDWVSNRIWKALKMQQPSLMLCEFRLQSVGEMKIRLLCLLSFFSLPLNRQSDGFCTLFYFIVLFDWLYVVTFILINFLLSVFSKCVHFSLCGINKILFDFMKLCLLMYSLGVSYSHMFKKRWAEKRFKPLLSL